MIVYIVLGCFLDAPSEVLGCYDTIQLAEHVSDIAQKSNGWSVVKVVKIDVTRGKPPGG